MVSVQARCTCRDECKLVIANEDQLNSSQYVTHSDRPICRKVAAHRRESDDDKDGPCISAAPHWLLFALG